jgi:heme exporter protein D
MAAKPKPYFLTVDERRKLQNDNIKRPGRYLIKQQKTDKIVKEGTKVLSARVSESAHRRFGRAIGHGKGFIKSAPLGPAIEEALMLWLAWQALDATVINLTCTVQSFEKHKALLANFRRRRRNRLSPDSDSYEHYATRVGAVVHIAVILPRARGGEKRLKRLEQLQAIFKAADVVIELPGIFPVDWEQRALERKKAVR